MFWNVRCVWAGFVAFAIFTPLLVWSGFRHIAFALAGAVFLYALVHFIEYSGHLIFFSAIGFMSRSHALRSEELKEMLAEVRAKEIMGEHFHGSDDALRPEFSKRFPRVQAIEALGDLLRFKEKELKTERKRSMLVAVLPVSIIEMRFLVPRDWFEHKRGDEADGRWYDLLTFARDKGCPHWQLVPLAPSYGDELLPARVIIFTILVHRIVTGKFLFAGRTIRCLDEDDVHGYVTVRVRKNGVICIRNSKTAELIMKKRHLRRKRRAAIRVMAARCQA